MLGKERSGAANHRHTTTASILEKCHEMVFPNPQRSIQYIPRAAFSVRRDSNCQMESLNPLDTPWSAARSLPSEKKKLFQTVFALIPLIQGFKPRISTKQKLGSKPRAWPVSNMSDPSRVEAFAYQQVGRLSSSSCLRDVHVTSHVALVWGGVRGWGLSPGWVPDRWSALDGCDRATHRGTLGRQERRRGAQIAWVTDGLL